MTSTDIINILAVEDSIADQGLLEDHILNDESSKYSIKFADDIDSAISLIDNLAELDLILLDLNLPGIGGLDTFITIHSHNPDIPVVILSGSDDEQLAFDCVAAGAHDFINKNVANTANLSHAIKFALARQKMVRLKEQKAASSVAKTSTLEEEQPQSLIGKSRTYTLDSSVSYDSIDKASRKIEDIIDEVKSNAGRKNTLIKKEIYHLAKDLVKSKFTFADLTKIKKIILDTLNYDSELVDLVILDLTFEMNSEVFKILFKQSDDDDAECLEGIL